MPPRIRKCILCGNEFEAPNGFIKRCSAQHYATCQVCGKDFPIDCEPNQVPKTCSRECMAKLVVLNRQKSAKDKYGVDDVRQLPEYRDKLREVYGSDEVKAKRMATSLQKYGVDNPAKSPEVRQRIQKAVSSEEYLQRRARTCKEKYGCESPMQSKQVQGTRAQNNLGKYGVTGVPWTCSRYLAAISDPHKRDNYLAFKSDPKQYLQEHYSEPPSVGTLCQDLGVTDTPIYDILIQSNCIDCVKRTHSQMEDEVVSFLQTIIPASLIERCNRTVLDGLEIDIFLPDYNLGIECNPAVTHNSSIPDPWGGPPKPYTYHQQKSFSAQTKGVFLFHIFGYDWSAHQNIIKSMLQNLLNANNRKIYGRDTYVAEVSYSECANFLDNNHRQGNTMSKVRLGLRLKSTDELVSVMAFGKMRSSMGKLSSDTDSVWELSRFCSLLNSNVIGGADKLFQYFVKNYSPHKVVSFSDIAHTKGNLYSKLKFSPVNTSSPSYVWSDKYDIVYYNRVSCQKRNLRNLFNDENINIHDRTEREIMMSRNFVQLYDCGVIRWEWCNSI